jgi:hypothetical protein
MDILTWIAAGERSRFPQVSNDDLEMYCVLCIDGSLMVLVHPQVYVNIVLSTRYAAYIPVQ